MKRSNVVRWTAIALLGIACATQVVIAAEESGTQEFVGSTPCDGHSRKFLGGIPTETPCHCITWRLTLAGIETGESGEYSLEVMYGMPGKDDPNQLVDGPTAKLKGKWDLVRGSKANSRAVVYRLHGSEADEPLLLARVGRRLLHFLNEDRTLRVGDAGWSYTLNLKRPNRGS